MSLPVKVIEKFLSTRILVIGDVILDQYIWGDVNRISPEAPIPVVEVQSENFRLGGAANTVANIRSLGGQVDVVSVVGKDENGAKLRRMLRDIGANVDGLLEDGGRPTITKTRVMARNQQVVRIDREAKHGVNDVLKKEIIRIIEDYIAKIDAVIVSDYDKGAISKDVLEAILLKAKDNDKPVVIDPKIQNFRNYKGATVVTPNLKEASIAFGRNITDDELLLCAGNTLLKELELEALLITRGEHGMSLFEPMSQPATSDANLLATQIIAREVSATSPINFRGPSQSKVTHIPTVAREVFDVTGAGDTVVAVFTLALTAGANILDAATIANYAAGIVVGEVGTASVTQEELIESISEVV